MRARRRGAGLVRGLVASLCALAAGVLAASLPCRADQPIEWRVGAQFRKQLQVSAGINWEKNPLRDGLTSLSRYHRVAILLDRRIDPDQLVDYAASGVTLDVLFRGLADHLQIGVSYVQSVVYFGPARVTSKLATLAAVRRQELRRLPEAARRRLAQPRAWQWEALAEPRKLVDQLAAEAGLELREGDRIPHDLWPPARLPPLSVVDRLTLVLAGFDLTFQLSPDAARVRLVPMPETLVLVRAYPAGVRAEHRAAELAKRFPRAAIRVVGRSLVVAASWEDHEAIGRLLRGRPIQPARPVAGRTVHTLRVERKPVGALIGAIAKQLNLQLTVDPQAQKTLQETVSIDVQDVSTEALLKAVLDPVGLTFQLEGKKLTVLPRPR